MMPLFDPTAIRSGDVVCREGNGMWSRLIIAATSHGRGWSHDALAIETAEGLFFGDAKSPRAVLSSIDDWERDIVDNGSRVLVIRPVGMSDEQGQIAAEWWRKNVLGKKYDWVSIASLALTTLWRSIRNLRLDVETRWYCTEGCRDAIAEAGLTPWHPKINPTPGTTYKRLLAGRFEIIEDALTAEGKRHRIAV